MELQVLLDALNACPPSRWRDAALSGLRNSDVSFAGSQESQLTISVQDLLQTYQIRLEHVRKHGMDVTGIEELLEALVQMPESARLRGCPFVGTDSRIYAFWDDNNVLIGCVTAKGEDRGERDLKVAMGMPL